VVAFCQERHYITAVFIFHVIFYTPLAYKFHAVANLVRLDYDGILFNYTVVPVSIKFIKIQLVEEGKIFQKLAIIVDAFLVGRLVWFDKLYSWGIAWKK
jgi:hypothetical protein